MAVDGYTSHGVSLMNHWRHLQMWKVTFGVMLLLSLMVIYHAPTEKASLRLGVKNLPLLPRKATWNSPSRWFNPKAAKYVSRKLSPIMKPDQIIRIFKHGLPSKNLKSVSEKSPMNWLKETHAVKKKDSCSIVGNSGVLTGSMCGDVIDEADFVIRMNLALFGGDFSRDVGSKINLMTMNMEDIRAMARCSTKPNAALSYKKLPAGCRRLIKALRLINGRALWYFKTKKLHKYIVQSLSYFKKHYNIQPHLAYSTKHLQLPKRKILRLKKYPSSGMLIYAAATQICSKITLFGFHPFASDPTNRTLKYHYYEDKMMNYNYYTTSKHGMPSEYQNLLHLQNIGAIRIVNDCAGKWDNRVLRKKSHIAVHYPST